MNTARRACGHLPSIIYLLSSNSETVNHIEYLYYRQNPSESLCLVEIEVETEIEDTGLRRFQHFLPANLRRLRSHLLPEEGGFSSAVPPHHLTLSLHRHFERCEHTK